MERKPLKNYSTSGSLNAVSVFQQTSFRVIIGFLLFVTIIITFALILTHITSDGFYLINTEVAVVSNDPQCDKIGLNMISRGGSAVDAVVATQLCLGVTHPHLTGIGGFGVMIIHNHITKQSSVVDFMSGVPNLFNESSKKDSHGSDFAVPGVLKGLAVAHKDYGKLPWAHIVLAVAQLAGRGFFMTESLYNALQATYPIANNLDHVFKSNGTLIDTEKKVYWDAMARTLETLARNGAEDFYSGKFAKEFLSSLPEGSLSESDLSSYSCGEEQPFKTSLNDWTVLTTQNAAGGSELHSSLDAFKNCNCTNEEGNLTYINQLTKILKSTWSDVNRTGFSMGRKSESVSVLAIDGEELMVALVSGLGDTFGSKIIAHGDIILNTPMPFVPKMNVTGSWMTPSIFFKEGEICGPRGAVASSNYQMVLQVLMNLVRGQNLVSAIEMPRYKITEMGELIAEGNKPDEKFTSAFTFVKVKDQILSSRDQGFGRFDN